MPEEVKTIVKIPLEEIEESVRSKHVLPKVLADVHIEENFSFSLLWMNKQQRLE